MLGMRFQRLIDTHALRGYDTLRGVLGIFAGGACTLDGALD